MSKIINYDREKVINNLSEKLLLYNDKIANLEFKVEILDRFEDEKIFSYIAKDLPKQYFIMDGNITKIESNLYSIQLRICKYKKDNVSVLEWFYMRKINKPLDSCDRYNTYRTIVAWCLYIPSMIFPFFIKHIEEKYIIYKNIYKYIFPILIFLQLTLIVIGYKALCDYFKCNFYGKIKMLIISLSVGVIPIILINFFYLILLLM